MSGIFSELLVAIVPSVVASFVTYILTKKKYNSEVRISEIQEMKESLEFYRTMADDNKKRLDEYLEIAEANRMEIRSLREGIEQLIKHSCVDSKCRKRKPISKEEVEQYIK